MQTPIMSPIDVPFTDDSMKVTSVHWNETSGLAVDIRSRRTSKGYVVAFESTCGFRTLHELDISLFWSSASKNQLGSTWLFEVTAGGWLELESTREDFYTKHQEAKPREYLVGGYQECVSVLSFSAPVVREALGAGA